MTKEYCTTSAEWLEERIEKPCEWCHYSEEIPDPIFPESIGWPTCNGFVNRNKLLWFDRDRYHESIL